MKNNYFIKKSFLKGKVNISGAKNSVLKLMTASLLTDDNVTILNYPNTLSDAIIHEEMLVLLGKKVEVKENIISIKSLNSPKTALLWNKRSIRNTLLILGCLLTRYGHASVPLPGGCKLGERKYDIHVSVLEQLGATVYEEHDQLIAHSNGRLIGAEIHLPMRSTGATENAIMASSLAVGTTEIYNPHIRPEILDLIDMLNNMGANIKVHGQEKIVVHGVDKLSQVTHSTIPDNMEALTWVVAAAITKGEIEILNFPFEHLEIPLIHLRESGVNIFRCGSSAIVKNSSIYPIDISTGPYPSINSDMQPIFAAFAACANGISKIVDLRFIGRYAYTEAYSKLNIRTEIDGNILSIHGNSEDNIIGNIVSASDLRAGISLALLALRSNEGIYIENSWQIDRGYNDFFKKLLSLGGNIERQ